MSPKGKPVLPVDVYTRVSRVGGRDVEAEGGTAAEQEKRCRAQLEADGLTLGFVLPPDLDESGGKSSRPSWDRAMERVRSGESGGIIVAKLNRAGRRVKNVLADIAEIEERGGAFISCHEKLDTSTPIGRFTLTIFAALAELELDERTVEWAGVHERLIERGVHFSATVPVGYIATLDDRGKRNGLALDPDRAPHVAEAFAMRARGESWRTIYRYLAANMAKRHKRTGKPMVRKVRKGGRLVLVPALGSIAAVQDVIENRVYTGEARFAGKIHTGAHPAIVEEGLWQAANRAKPPRHPSRGDVALLAGRLRCAECKGPLTADTNGRGSRVYRCKSKPDCGAKAAIVAGKIEPYFESLTLARIRDLAPQGFRDPAGPDTSILDSAVERARYEEDLWLERAKAGESPDIAIPAFEAAKARRLDAEEARAKAVATEQLSEEQESAIALLRAGDPELIEKLWREQSIPWRRKMIAYVVPAMYVAKGRGAIEERLTEVR
jgi:DNA invertase Pin-like site-specific DNA recombinase